jgi:hypothetical protein
VVLAAKGGSAEKTDEELADERTKGDVVVTISRKGWYQGMLHHPEWLADLRVPSSTVVDTFDPVADSEPGAGPLQHEGPAGGASAAIFVGQVYRSHNSDFRVLQRSRWRTPTLFTESTGSSSRAWFGRRPLDSVINGAARRQRGLDGGVHECVVDRPDGR